MLHLCLQSRSDANRTYAAHYHSKVARGFENFEKNTGSAHPAAKKVQKRATGNVPLTDDEDGELWQGAISVGTPAVTFTGAWAISGICYGDKLTNPFLDQNSRL